MHLKTKWYNSTLYGQRFTSFLACGTRRAVWITSAFLRLDVGQTQLLHPVKCCWLTIRTCCIVQTMTSLEPEGLARPFRIATVLLQGDCCISLWSGTDRSCRVVSCLTSYFVRHGLQFETVSLYSDWGFRKQIYSLQPNAGNFFKYATTTYIHILSNLFSTILAFDAVKCMQFKKRQLLIS